jgi:hypothetical protein
MIQKQIQYNKQLAKVRRYRIVGSPTDSLGPYWQPRSEKKKCRHKDLVLRASPQLKLNASRARIAPVSVAAVSDLGIPTNLLSRAAISGILLYSLNVTSQSLHRALSRLNGGNDWLLMRVWVVIFSNFSQTKNARSDENFVTKQLDETLFKSLFHGQQNVHLPKHEMLLIADKDRVAVSLSRCVAPVC